MKQSRGQAGCALAAGRQLAELCWSVSNIGCTEPSARDSLLGKGRLDLPGPHAWATGDRLPGGEQWVWFYKHSVWGHPHAVWQGDRNLGDSRSRGGIVSTSQLPRSNGYTSQGHLIEYVLFPLHQQQVKTLYIYCHLIEKVGTREAENVAHQSAVWVLSHVQFFATPWTVACQAPLSMGFSRREYWSGLPFPTPGNLPDPGIKLASPESFALAGGFFATIITQTLSQISCGSLFLAVIFGAKVSSLIFSFAEGCSQDQTKKDKS